MHVIGVLDIRGGRAVHAVGGNRAGYAPVETVAGRPIDAGNALALARGYIDLAVEELYVADLDAILGGPTEDALIAALASLGLPVWLDAGIASPEHAERARALGASRVVVGLETLPSFEALGAIAEAIGGRHAAFSLDLRDGKPILAPGARIPPGEPADRLAAGAVEAGVGAVIVLDLARVGTGRGPHIAKIAEIREAVPGSMLVAGGGVRGPEDLLSLARAGCDASLVATALHDGRLGPPALR